MQLLRPALSMYRAPRLISLGGFIARELEPRRGVVAGCGFATTLVKAYCKQPFDDFIALVKEHEGGAGSGRWQDEGLSSSAGRGDVADSTEFDAYIDDFALNVQGASQESVIERMVFAQEKLKEIIEQDLDTDIALEKAGLVATSDELAKRLRDCIGLGAGAALLLLSGILLVVRGAPESRANRSGSSDINFGR